MALDPLHCEPAGHSVQLVRVVAVPPDVNEPSRHVKHPSASFPLYSLSAPHFVQFAALCTENVPARHGEQDDAPSSAYRPGAQSEQLVACAPENCPGSHTAHDAVAFAPVYRPGTQAVHGCQPQLSAQSLCRPTAHGAQEPYRSLPSLPVTKYPVGHPRSLHARFVVYCFVAPVGVLTMVYSGACRSTSFWVHCINTWHSRSDAAVAVFETK